MALLLLAAGCGPLAAPGTPSLLAPTGTEDVRVGATLTELRARGVPVTVLLEPGEAAGDCGSARIGGPDGLDAMLNGEVVVRFGVEGASPVRWRTPEGAGVGTTAAELERLYGARLRCAPHQYVDENRNATVDPDKATGTIFEVGPDGVYQWRTGRWPEVGFVEGCS